MKGGAVARRYAKALLDLAARDDQVVEIGDQLHHHQALFQASEDLQAILWHPGGGVARCRQDLVNRPELLSLLQADMRVLMC